MGKTTGKINKNEPTSTRKEQAMKTKENLYNTAIDLFNKQGYDKTTVEDIVNNAGTATGTFYLYFRTKRDIILQTVAKYDLFFDEAYEKAKEHDSFAKQLACFYHYDYVKLQETGKEILKALYWNSLQEESDIVNNPNRPLYGYIENMVNLGISTGELPSEHSCEYYVRQIIITALGIDCYWCTTPNNVDILEFANERIVTLIKGLCNS